MATLVTPPRTPIRSWTTQAEGARLVGRFEGLREGKFGLLADLDTADGLVTVPAPTVLAGHLAQVAPGALITIVHHGLRASSKNPTRQYRDFTVEPDDQTPERRAPEPEAPAESDTVGAEDVPF